MFSSGFTKLNHAMENIKYGYLTGWLKSISIAHPLIFYVTYNPTQCILAVRLKMTVIREEEIFFFLILFIIPILYRS